jgi:hypothetical protein
MLFYFSQLFLWEGSAFNSISLAASVFGKERPMHGSHGACNRSPFHLVLCFFAFCLIVLAPHRASALTKSWADGTGNWNSPGNWNPAVVPVAGDIVNIVDADGIARTITYNYPGPNITLGILTIDLTGGVASNNLLINGANNLSTGNQVIGLSGNGLITQSAGTNTAVSANLSLGVNAGSAGTYALSGGTLSAVNTYVGGTAAVAGGFGELNISNSGAATFSGALKVWNSGATAVNLTGGSLTVGSIDLSGNYSHLNWTAGSFTTTSASQYLDLTTGADPAYNSVIFGNTLSLNANQSFTNNTWEYLYDAGSTISQSGGSNSSPHLYMGNTSGAGSPAAYDLTGGSLSASVFEEIGYIGTYGGATGSAVFTHSGGTNTTASFYLGHSPGTGSGTYNLSGTGILTVNGPEYIGYGGTGTLTQTNGSNVVNDGGGLSLRLGQNAGVTGTYSLSGGTLDTTGGATSLEVIGVNGSGVFNHSGGSNTTTTLDLALNAGASGTYSLSNTGTFSGANGYIGGASGGTGGTGILNISGGSMTFSGNLKVWNTAGTAINFSGGSLTVGSIDLSGNYSLLNWTAGAFTTTSPNQYLDITDGADPLFNSIIFGNALTLNANQSFTNNTWEYLFGKASSITQNGGSNSTPDLYMGNTSGAGAPAAYTLSSGTLTASDAEFIGYIGAYNGATGNAAFSQTGGSNTVGTLDLGESPGVAGSASYALSGGTISATVEFIGNTNGLASFTQTAGSNTSATNIQFARSGASSASYSISGGSLSAVDAYLGGTTTLAGGTANLNISGSGSVTLSGTLKIWDTFGTVLNFSGGTLTVGFIDLSGNYARFHWTAGAFTTTSFAQYLDFTLGTDPFYHSIIFGNSLTLNANESFTNNTWEYLYDAGSSITQNGGSNTTPELYMGNTSGAGNPALYILNSGSLSIAGDEKIGYIGTYVGAAGDAVFNQFGGTNSTPHLYVGYKAGTGSGTYNLFGGILAVSSIESLGVISGTAFFNQSGGNHTIAGDLYIAENAASTATFTLSGGSVQAGGLYVGGNFGGAGGAGTLSITGGSMTVNSALVYSTGAFTISNTGSFTTPFLLLLGSAVGQTGGTSYFGAVTDNGFGALVILGGTAQAASLRLNTVTISGGSLTVVSNGTPTGASKVNSLNFAGAPNNWQGTVDITNNFFVLQPTALNKATALANIRNQALNHNLTSASVVADPVHKTLVIVDNALFGLLTYNGLSVDANSLLVEATYYGDTNLDRKVDVTDLGILATNYGKNVPNGILQGDFNNDGKVDVTDLGLLATDYGLGTSGPPFSVSSLNSSVVPEPSALVFFLPMLLLARKRT